MIDDGPLPPFEVAFGRLRLFPVHEDEENESANEDGAEDEASKDDGQRPLDVAHVRPGVDLPLAHLFQIELKLLQ